MDPCCAVKVGPTHTHAAACCRMLPAGDLNVVCTLGPLSNAWYGALGALGPELSAPCLEAQVAGARGGGPSRRGRGGVDQLRRQRLPGRL